MATVIPFPLPPEPRLREALRNSGVGVITAWISPGARARFRIRVRNLRRVARTQWSIKQFRYLEVGLYEIKWEFGKKQFRVAGFDRSGYFVMVVGFTHKQGVCDPHDWLNTAKQRKGEVERGERRTIDFEP